MERMVLTPRLACIASLIPQGARLADIGTDHGKLPVSLLMAGKIVAAIGSDIGEGPLAHAARNAADYNVCLSLRLAAGLDAVQPEECNTISIAGMGGQTIAEILAAAPWCEQGRHLLLLQPMTMIYELRQWLWAHGYAIERETICREDRRQYVVLSVRGGGEKKELPLWRCAFSSALLQVDGALEYLQALLTREERALEGMRQANEIDKAQLDAQHRLVMEIKLAWEGLQ